MNDVAPHWAAPQVVGVEPSVGAAGRCLVWTPPAVMRGISSSIVGGGIGPVSWALNMTVDADYGRLDPDHHLIEVARRLRLDGPGVAMMTAVDVRSHQTADECGVFVMATVGANRPVWAADRSPAAGRNAEHVVRPGTINLIIAIPALLSDAALVNVVATATEAKVQSLLDHGVDGTGTASDAIAVLCATGGPAEPFGGPRSTWGARTARAVHDAVSAGIAAQRKSD